MDHTPRHLERGAALIVGLIFMLVASVVAMSSMRGSTIQEGMTANLNNKAVSFMAAEAGAAAFTTLIADEAFAWGTSDWQQQIAHTRLAATAVDDANAALYWVESVDWTQEPAEVIVRGVSRASDGTDLSDTAFFLQFSSPTTGGVNPAFRAGLLADLNIDVKGNAQFTGSAHANGNFNVTGGNSSLSDRTILDEDGNPVVVVSTVSAQGSASMNGGGVNGDNVISNSEAIEVPSASLHIQETIGASSLSTEKLPHYTESCNIPSGNHGGAVFWCNGNATTSGAFSNATVIATGNVTATNGFSDAVIYAGGDMNVGGAFTGSTAIAEGNATTSGNFSSSEIMAKGNITHNGSAQLGGDHGSTLTVKFAAGGDITVNGSNDTYGVFWADGDITQNGSSTLGGAIVAGGTIRRNGVFNYVQYDDFGNMNLPTGAPQPSRLQTWREFISG